MFFEFIKSSLVLGKAPLKVTGFTISNHSENQTPTFSGWWLAEERPEPDDIVLLLIDVLEVDIGKMQSFLDFIVETYQTIGAPQDSVYCTVTNLLATHSK